MRNRLSTSVKALRRERALTQEQLAEAMGVTPGAVYKWEAALSVPDIDTIISLAEFFEVSVDALLGYELHSGSLSALLERLVQHIANGNLPEGKDTCDRLLARYPNSFEAVYYCATFSMLDTSDAGRRRAAELFYRSLELISQNSDRHISEVQICKTIAKLHFALEEYDKAIEVLQRHSLDPQSEAVIGVILAMGRRRPDEALEHCSAALLGLISPLVDICTGYVYACCDKQEFALAEELLLTVTDFIGRQRQPGQCSYLDRLMAVFYAACARCTAMAGQEERARGYLRQALETARKYDRDPVLDTRGLRFYSDTNNAILRDDLGETAREAVLNIIGDGKLKGLPAAPILFTMLKELEDEEN